jgi:hypothetical protein
MRRWWGLTDKNKKLSMEISSSKKPVELLSKHLFWDTPVSSIDVEKNKEFIVQRVLEYGLMNDWNLITKWYGINEIGKTATGFRSLDAKALAFLINITGLSLNDFRCYTMKQSIPTHWNY